MPAKTRLRRVLHVCWWPQPSARELTISLEKENRGLRQRDFKPYNAISHFVMSLWVEMHHEFEVIMHFNIRRYCNQSDVEVRRDKGSDKWPSRRHYPYYGCICTKFGVRLEKAARHGINIFIF